MHSLKAITALGGNEAQVDIVHGLTVTECPDWAIASVAARMGKEKPLATAFKKAMGMALPKPSKSIGKGGITVFWTGPNQYFVEAPIADNETLADTLADALKRTASITEQTDGWVRFDVQGTGCSDVFERLCILDTRAMTKGAVSRTTLEHSGCFILCRTHAYFSVYGPRSTAASLHHGLVTAAKSALG
ncbi:MAG: sarcosine oxidase subunit gamma [Amylibacter sp.]